MKSLSLRARLLLWSSATSVLTLGLIVVLVDQSFRTQVRGELDATLGFARRVAEDVRASRVDAQISETAALALDTRLRAAVSTGDVQTIRQTLTEVSPLRPPSWSAVVRVDGSILAASKGAPVVQIRDAADLVTEALYYDTGDLWRSDEQLVDVAASAMLFGASPIAVLITGRPIDSGSVIALESSVGRAAVILGEESFTPGNQARGLSSDAESALSAWVESAGDRVGLVELDGERFVAAASPLRASDGTELGTTVLLGSFDQALGPSNTLRALLIGILLLGLAMTFGMSGVFSRGITVPVARLLEDTARLASGDLERPVVPLRDDEIGRLASSFEDMRVSLRSARSELIRVERLGAIGRAASAVAHDFTQPLSTIAGAVGLLRVGKSDPDLRDRCCDAIESELERLGRMKQEIVEFARGESSFEGARIKIDSFLENTVSALRQSLAVRGVTLRVQHGFGGVWHIDSYRLGRMLENLIRNAAAAISGEGTIELRSSLRAESLVLEVEDDGSGIPDDVIEEIFEPFATHGKKEGTGLGLAIARNVAHQHGGTIEVRSSPAGTTFTVTLPELEAAARTAPEPAPIQGRRSLAAV